MPEFVNCLEDNFFTQHVDFSTRNDAILDLAISDEPHMVSELTDLGVFPGSDHKALTWKFAVKTIVESIERKIYDFRKADIESMRRDLQSVNWTEQFSGLSAELSWLLFKDYLEMLQQKHIPTVHRSHIRGKPIWMTHKALKAVKHRRLIYSKYKDSRHPAYVKAAKHANHLIKQARQNFEELLAKKIKEDRKSFFAYARSKSKCNVRVGDLSNSQGQMVSAAAEKAELLNSFFSSVFTRESVESIPLPDPCFTGSVSQRLCDITVDVSVIADKLCALRPDKSAGDDNLSPRLLRDLSTELSTPVSLIFRRSLDTSCVPRDWRTAIVSPLFKKGRRSEPGNYRPVSLTSQIVKVVESVLRDAIVNHLEKFNLIKQSQHGFRKGYSCVSNLLSFLESVTASVDAKQNVDTVYLDFAKAFDKVPHQRLLLKLRAHGIDGVVCNWIEAWLRDRWQKVRLEGCSSSWRQVFSGVPQGSVLGPVLFLIFINDLEVGTTSGILKFADDTKLFRSVVNQADHTTLQNDLDKVCEWADRWEMKFNVSKCKVMHYGRKITGIEPSYCMYGKPIEIVCSEKDLGVVFSNDLKVSLHCRDSYSKANRMLGLISRTIRYRHPTVLLNLYKSLVRPHLDYCSSVWNPYYIKDIELLERVQHRFTRLFSELRILPYDDRLRQLGLWSLQERRNRTDLIELFKLVKGFSSTPWNEFFFRMRTM